MTEKDLTTQPASTQTQVYDETVTRILSGQKKFSDLDFSVSKDRRVALDCIKAKQDYVFSLNADNEFERMILKEWVRGDYRNLLVLKKEQWHKELIDIYLFLKFTKGADYQSDSSLSILRGYDQKLMFIFSYVTKEGETVAYFDKTLGVPTKLKTTATIKLKLLDSASLVKKIDISLQWLDRKLVLAQLNNVINGVLRDIVLSTIEENNVTFFDLPRYFTYIGEKIKSELEKALLTYGLSVSDVNIINIVIPNNTGEVLEKQFLYLAKERNLREFEHDMESASLKFYEQKAAIHEKYPEFPITLTETEKDFALERYLKRIGKENSHTEDIVEESLEKRDTDLKGSLTKTTLKMPVAPEEPPKSKTLAIFISLFAVAIVVAGLLFIASKVAGFIALGVVILGFGLYATFAFDKLKKSGAADKRHKEYQRQYEEYQKALDDYYSKQNETK